MIEPPRRIPAVSARPLYGMRLYPRPSRIHRHTNPRPAKQCRRFTTPCEALGLRPAGPYRRSSRPRSAHHRPALQIPQKPHPRLRPPFAQTGRPPRLQALRAGPRRTRTGRQKKYAHSNNSQPPSMAAEFTMLYSPAPQPGSGFYRNNRERLTKLEKACGAHAQQLIEEIKALDHKIYEANAIEINRL